MLVAWRAWIAPALGSAASAPVTALRRAQKGLTVSPRARARLLAGFLAVNLIIVILPAANVQRLELDVPRALIRQLEADSETSLANTYSAVVWGVVAVLAVAQLLRSPASSRRRWLWRLGWLSVALLAALIALEERASLKDAIGRLTLPVDLAPIPIREALPRHTHWLAVVAPLLAAPLAAAGLVLLTSQRLHPARALLTLLAIVFVACPLVLDSYALDFAPIPWSIFLEEGSELSAAAILVVILIETLAARPGTVPDAPERRCRERGRRGAALAATAALLAASALPLLLTQHVFEDKRWGWGAAPWSYTGPISLVEQRFRATHDNLQRVDVWVYIDGAPGAAADIFARLAPAGSDRPLRESRAEVRGARFSNDTVAFHFAPIPDSGGMLYTLTIGVLSGPTPYVFLGLTGGDVIPEGTAVVSGAPTPYADDVPMRTTWSGRFIEGLLEGLLQQDPRNLKLFGAVILFLFLWVFPVVATWAGLSGRRPRFWRRFVWPAVLTSALITAGILVITLALFAVLSPMRLA